MVLTIQLDTYCEVKAKQKKFLREKSKVALWLSIMHKIDVYV